jgi:hypothetical protein
MPCTEIIVVSWDRQKHINALCGLGSMLNVSARCRNCDKRLVALSCLSGCNKLATSLMKFYTWDFSQKSIEKSQVSLKSETKNYGYLTWRCVNIYDNVSPIFLRRRNVSNKSFKENQNTHLMFSNFFRKLCRLWDNVGKQCGAGEAVDNMAPARGILDKYGYSRANTLPRHAPTQTHARIYMSSPTRARERTHRNM